VCNTYLQHRQQSTPAPAYDLLANNEDCNSAILPAIVSSKLKAFAAVISNILHYSSAINSLIVC